MRTPEQPEWTLMVNHNGDVVRVRQEYEAEKVTLGWVMVARESDLLPFNAPRLLPEDEP